VRIKLFTAVIIGSFILLICSLFYVQVFQGTYYKGRSEDNRIVVMPLESPRGKIIDRNGKVIVDNRVSFDVSVVYKDAVDLGSLTRFLADTVGINKKQLARVFERARWRPFVPTLIAEDIGKEKAIIVEQSRIDFPGLIISTKPRRDYTYGKEASSFTGYLGKIREDELARFRTYGYSTLDWIGRDGLEKVYDDYLRGTHGGMQLETDSRGRQLRVLHIKEAKAGKPIYITIDMDLQAFCSEVMGDRKGSIIVMDPRNGEVFSIVSKPQFDPNIFVRRDTGDEVRKILRNEKRDYPLLNRAISCAYPPGSVFKIVTAIAALQTGAFKTNMQFVCNSTFLFGRRIFHCWYEKGHKTQFIEDAIKNSCNVFFWKLGLKVGAKSIAFYADMLGFGHRTGIDLPGEVRGLLPSPKWKKAVMKENWYAGDTMNYCIGQGFLLVTPIQIVHMTATVGNGGYSVRPYLVERVGDVEFSNPEIKKLNISDQVIAPVKKGMVKVVNDRRGTGMKAKLEHVIVAGKTGTAQNPRGKAHGWFSCFAPSENPKVCVVVFVEYGGKGGVEASMIAKKVLEKTQEVGLL